MSPSSTTPLETKPTKVFRPKRSRRAGVPSKDEQALVKQFVKDQPAEVTPGQISQLAKLLRRSEGTVKGMIERARADFASAAQTYVDTHLLATTGALDKGDFETAGKLSQWALENLGAEGVRIVEKKGNSEAPSGPRVVVGIQLGGLGKLPSTVTLPAVEAEVVRE